MSSSAFVDVRKIKFGGRDHYIIKFNLRFGMIPGTSHWILRVLILFPQSWSVNSTIYCSHSWQKQYRAWCIWIHTSRQNVYLVDQFLGQRSHPLLPDHDGAIWGAAWTSTDNGVSISADGSIYQWSCATGHHHSPKVTLEPHTLALVSLSVAPDGKRALYNSLEGHTRLLDLESSETIASYESYLETKEDAEPCKFASSGIHMLVLGALILTHGVHHSLVRFAQSQWQYLCLI